MAKNDLIAVTAADDVEHDGFDTCVVCDSSEPTDLALYVYEGLDVGRVAWCADSGCQDDLEQSRPFVVFVEADGAGGYRRRG